MSATSNLARKSVFVLSFNIFGGVMGYITMFFVLRLVGQGAWGIFGSALAMAGLLSILTNLGVNTTHVKKVTQRKDIEKCQGAFLLIKGVLGALFILISFLTFFVVGELFGFKFESDALRDAVYLAIFGYLLSSISGVFGTIYRSQLDARKSVTPMFLQVTVQDLLIIAFTLYFTFLPKFSRDSAGVLYAYSFLMGNFAMLIFYIILAIKDKIRFSKPDYNLLREYVLFSIPLALLGIVGTIQAYTDRAMLQFFWNYKEVGGYFTVQKIALFVIYLGISVQYFLYPAQSTYYEKAQRDNFFRITLKSERYLSILVVPIVFFTFAMSYEILNLFNRSLIYYSIPLIILMIYAYLNVINQPYGSQMTSANRPKEVMKMGIIQASVNVVLNAILIPTSILGLPLFGLKSSGAALATLLSFSVGFVYLRYKVRKHLNMKYEWKILLHLLCGFLSFISLLIIKHYLGPLLSWYAIILSFLLFIGIYAGILYLLGELHKEDINMLLRIFKP